MSFNRDNVIWESSDGSWNIGFYDVFWIGEDPEWDVEYDYDHFQWVSTGHFDEYKARNAWQGSNPGSYTYFSYNGNEEESARFDEMAQEFLANDTNDFPVYSLR